MKRCLTATNPLITQHIIPGRISMSPFRAAIQLMLCCCITAILFSASAFVFAQDNRSPFFPSQVRTENGQPIKHEQYESPEICSGCHTGIYSQWKGSMHAAAFIDPIFQSLWKLAEKETGGLTRNLCGGCHGAVGVLSNQLTFKDGEFHAPDIAKEGIHCDLCHTIVASTFADTPNYEPGNASFIAAPGPVKRGPHADSESPYHDTAYSELHTRSLFCANCHQVFHPVTNFHIERTYDEWKYSVYAQNDIQCQDCHMMPVDKAAETARTLKKQNNPGKSAIMGPEREKIFTHEFVGANFTVPELLGNTDHAQTARQRLKSAAEITLDVPERIRAGELGEIAVTVTNVGAGHNLPTSLTDVRQMWLDVQVADTAGHVLYRSGGIDEQGDIVGDPRIFNAHALDSNGRDTHKPWEIAKFKHNRTIPPKGSATEKFFFLVPAGLKGELSVRAILRYRSYPQSLANALLGDKSFKLPVCDMTSAEAVIALAQ